MTARSRILGAAVLPVVIMIVLPFWWYGAWSAHSAAQPQRLYPPTLLGALPVYVHRASVASTATAASQSTWHIRLPEPTPSLRGALSLGYGDNSDPDSVDHWTMVTWEHGDAHATLTAFPGTTSAWLHLRYGSAPGTPAPHDHHASWSLGMEDP